MDIQNSQLDFTDQAFHIGMDVHQKHWSVVIRSEGMELRRFSMNPSPLELARYMRRHYPCGRYISVYEAGFCGFWIHRELTKLGFENLVVHSPDVPTGDKERQNKTDRVDASKLTRELEKNSLEGIYIPSEFNEQLRALCRARHQATQSQTRVKNRIKSLLATQGITLPSHQQMPHWSGRFIKYLESVEFSHACGTDCLKIYLEELGQHRQRIVDITRTLRHHIKENGLRPLYDFLCSVPGIGPILALTLYTELIDIWRFKTFDELACYVGLVPALHGTGDKVIDKGLTHRKNRYLQYLMVEASWVAIRKDPALLLAFKKLTQRMKKQDAIIRIAKKLLRRIQHVWKNQTPYVLAVVETPQTKKDDRTNMK